MTYGRGVLVLESDPQLFLGSIFPAGTLITTADGHSIGTVDELHARIDRAAVFFRGGGGCSFNRPFLIEAILPNDEERMVDLWRVGRGSSR